MQRLLSTPLRSPSYFLFGSGYVGFKLAFLGQDVGGVVLRLHSQSSTASSRVLRAVEALGPRLLVSGP